MSGVDSNLVFEDDKIATCEFNPDLGGRTPLHTSETDYIFYVIDDTTLAVFDADNDYLGPPSGNPGRNEIGRR